MSSGTLPKYNLDDVVARSAPPPTFKPPSEAEIQALRVGDIVKLVFLYPQRAPSDHDAEPLWVEITRVKSGASPTFKGLVADIPNRPDLAGVRFGTTITFEAHHIASLDAP